MAAGDSILGGYSPSTDVGYQNALAILAAQNSGGSYGAAGNAAAAQYGGDAQKYAAAQQAAAAKYSADAQKASANQASQLQYNLGASQLGFQQSKYNQLFPLLSGAASASGGATAKAPAPPGLPSSPSYGAGGSGSYGGGGGSAGGEAYGLPAPPSIGGFSAPAAPGVGAYPTAPALGPVAQGGHDVLSGGQIQQQVNQAQAANDATAAGATTRAIQDAGGRGVGATSPLAQALKAQISGQNLNANTLASTNTRLQGAQLNAANNQQYDLANLNSATQLAGARTAAGASEYGAAQQAAAAQYAASAGAASSAYGAGLGAQASEYGSQVDALSSLRNALTAAQSSNYNAQLGYNASTYSSGLDYQSQLAAIQAQRQSSLLSALASAVG